MKAGLAPCFLKTSAAAALISAVVTPGLITDTAVTNAKALIRPASRINLNSCSLLMTTPWRPVTNPLP